MSEFFTARHLLSLTSFTQDCLYFFQVQIFEVLGFDIVLDIFFGSWHLDLMLNGHDEMVDEHSALHNQLPVKLVYCLVISLWRFLFYIFLLSSCSSFEDIVSMEGYLAAAYSCFLDCFSICTGRIQVPWSFDCGKEICWSCFFVSKIAAWICFSMGEVSDAVYKLFMDNSLLTIVDRCLFAQMGFPFCTSTPASCFGSIYTNRKSKVAWYGIWGLLANYHKKSVICLVNLFFSRLSCLSVCIFNYIAKYPRGLSPVASNHLYIISHQPVLLFLLLFIWMIYQENLGF